MTTVYHTRVAESVQFLKNWYPGLKPEILVVLGSGLSRAMTLDRFKSIPFKDIPGFKHPTIEGHLGELHVGYVQTPQGKERLVAAFCGRIHAYEGHDPGQVVHGIRVFKSLGIKGVVLTNASGCLVPQWDLGRFMMITDHINLTGMSPLSSPYGDGFGARFVDMGEAYHPGWQAELLRLAQALDTPLYSEVFCGVPGPHYETPAEIRMLQIIGGHAVAMSTVLETIAARQLNLKVAGLSCLTNHASGLGEPISHQEVAEMTAKHQESLSKFLTHAVGTLT